MDAIELIPSCRLLCPRERYEKAGDDKVIKISGQNHYIIESSYFISDDDEDEDFNDPDHSLLLRNKKEGEENDLHCYACREKITSKTFYLCNNCKDNYHKKCIESSPVFQSPDHPKHPLQLLFFPLPYFYHERDCCSCRKSDGHLFYYCFICDFMIHSTCARNPTSLTIDNRKRHEHTLHYFPRKSALICDVCALEGDIDYLYVCLLCDFIIHKRCVYFPYVIKTSRHNHRLAFTPTLPYKELTNCGVCHAKINENHGEYSCTKGCAYAMHSRCAMRGDVCDGKELEGVPEETNEIINMFKKKGDGIIQHLSHPHHQMRLDKKIQRFYDENKRCQACMLPFYDDRNVYRCMECDFNLHESCAYIPYIKEFMLHIHPLTLEFGYTTSWVNCMKCNRYTCGFTYVCRLQKCDLVLDTLCASIYEPFDHHAHPHPLYIPCDENKEKTCSICQSWKTQALHCVKCNFVLCFGCTPLPQKVRYKNDDHLLTFFYEKYANDEFYWCEICEKNINPKNGSYACNKCEVTFHIDCVLGKDPHLKPGKSRKLPQGWVSVLSNTCSTRPICKSCKSRCPYKITIETSRKYIFCSFSCYDDYYYRTKWHGDMLGA